MEISALLNEATAKKGNGEIDEAIKLLREAYSEIAQTNIDYTVTTFLRLPLYLQEAKRNDEAWREFNLLLTVGYPNQLQTPGAIENDESIIYDKMRLFLQREDNNTLAIQYGILSYLSSAVGRYIIKDRDEFFKAQYENWISKNTYKKIIIKLLKKAKQEDKLQEICDVVQNWINVIPTEDILVVEEAVAKIVNNK